MTLDRSHTVGAITGKLCAGSFGVGQLMTGNFPFSLALGGGGARGIAHVHVLKALDDIGVRPRHIAASSIGSIVGSGYASGMSGREIEEFFLSTFSNRTAALGRLWRARPDPIRAMVTGEKNPGAFGQMDIERVLAEFLPNTLPRDFSDLSIPITITATDYYGNALKCLESGDLWKAIAASSAIPVVFTPVLIDGVVLIDGGINNPVPFDILDATKGARIAVDVVGLPRGEPGNLPGRIDLGFGASQLLMQSITGIKLKTNPPDLFLRPDVDDFRVLDFLKVREILKATEAVYDETRRGVERLMETSQPGIAS